MAGAPVYAAKGSRRVPHASSVRVARRPSRLLEARVSDPLIELYAETFKHVWDQPQVPTPAELADWLESRRWRVDPQWLAEMVARLRAWPKGRNYPLIPDDMAMMVRAEEESRWWRPGAVRGDLLVRLPRIPNH